MALLQHQINASYLRYMCKQLQQYIATANISMIDRMIDRTVRSVGAHLGFVNGIGTHAKLILAQAQSGKKMC